MKAGLAELELWCCQAKEEVVFAFLASLNFCIIKAVIYIVVTPSYFLHFNSLKSSNIMAWIGSTQGHLGMNLNT